MPRAGGKVGDATATVVAAERPEFDELSERILEAARGLFARFGPSRTTMDDVARIADVSRITVYRRFSSKDDLLEAAVRREFQLYFERFQSDIAECATVDDRVAVGFASSLLYIRQNDFIRALMTDDPTGFVSSIVGAAGTTQTLVRGFVAERLREEQGAGTIATGTDVDLVAEIIVRLTTSFLVTPGALVDLDDRASLVRVARTALVPLLNPA